MPYYYYDFTYILVIIGMVLCLGASFRVTGAEAARRILNNEGLYNVQIECLQSDSGDHYDPRSNTVRLSYQNFNEATVTAVGVRVQRWQQAGDAHHHSGNASKLE